MCVCVCVCVCTYGTWVRTSIGYWIRDTYLKKNKKSCTSIKT